MHDGIYQNLNVNNSNYNSTFIALNLPIQEDSKAQQNQKSSRQKFSIQRHKSGQAPQRMPGE